MGYRSMWKMMHLLYTLPQGTGQTGLTSAQLEEVGIDCWPDTVDPLVASGAVTIEDGFYRLSAGAKQILQGCVVANGQGLPDEMWVDYPMAFIVMPFKERWSDAVYNEFIEPAVLGADLECVRGDEMVRIGELGGHLKGALMRAGVIIADVSALNANVFYELGLAHALGKDTFLLKQAKARVPADIGGALYHEYALQKLSDSKEWLRGQLVKWSADRHSAAVKALKVGMG
jgi:hypothetical protein